jgi:hypothetical protein
MANILLKNLVDTNTPGHDLFHDSESFMRDLSEEDSINIQGGKGESLTVGAFLLSNLACVGAVLVAEVVVAAVVIIKNT